MDQWYVIKTKPKKERSVVIQLQGASFEVLLPQIRALGSHAADRPSSLKPLFPAYLFVKTDFNDPYLHRMVRYTRGVSRILGDDEGPVPISESIVETLRERTKDGSVIEQDLLFREGDEVTVKRGILKDLRGIIEKNLSETGRVGILFKWLNNSVRATLRYTELEKVA